MNYLYDDYLNTVPFLFYDRASQYVLSNICQIIWRSNISVNLQV